jgi:hypothetical protein
LCLERSRVGKVLFLANEAAEANLDLFGRRTVERIEEKGFDGEIGPVKGGPGAGVGNGMPDSAARHFEGLGYVDAARNDLTSGRFEIERRNGLLGANAVPFDHFPFEKETAVQETPCKRDIAAVDALSNLGTGDDLAAVDNGRKEVSGEVMGSA